MTAAQTRRNDTDRRVSYLTVTFERVGEVPTGRGQVPTLPPLTVLIPPHTAQHGKACPVGEHGCPGKAAHIDAMIAHLTLPLREHVRMSPKVPEQFTVTIGLDVDGNRNATGTGTVLINGGRHGHGKITATDL